MEKIAYDPQLFAQEEGPEGADTGGQTPQQSPEAAPRPSWEELMADPEYNRRMQETVKARLRSERSSQERLTRLTPALEELSRRYSLQSGDDEGLVRAVAGEGPQARQRFDPHFQSLERQAQQMRQVFPGFDLRQELKNPVFAQLTAPGTGVGVEDAYYALHRRELQAASMQVAAQKTARKLSSAIRSAGRRPVENGAASRAASVETADYRAATPQQREALKQRIRAAAARGEKLYPGI